jgi:hypothetical protein
MAVITVTDLHKGINFKDSALSIVEGGVAESIGFDLTKEGSLVTTPVFSDNDISSYLPSETITWLQCVQANGQNYFIA